MQSWLSWFLRGLLFLAAMVLFARLVELQIIKGDYFEKLANGNSVRRIPITAPRGEIRARGGEVLSGNIEVKKAIVFDSHEGYQKKDDIEGVPADDIISEWRRDYFTGADTAHVTGYLGEVNLDEVGKVDGNCPEKGPRRLGQLVGRSGLEEGYECTLQGIDGEELVEVDSMGRKVRVLGIKKPIPGQDLVTTIDIGLQRKAAKVMGNVKGAVVATDGHGQVLVLYSSPSFDPNSPIKDYVNDESLPLFNRTIGGTYHPGSVFKMVTSTAALEDGKITPDFTYEDPGVITIGDFKYSNWYFSQYGRTEGVINLARAIARSTDTFFYKVGEMVGAERIAFWANVFGLGNLTGIDLPGEVANLIPSPEWKQKVKGELWFLGNTYHFAIGQGDVAITPLSVNIMTSVVAESGLLCKPHLMSGDEKCNKLPIKLATFEEIRKGMIGACSGDGTGYPFFDFKPQIACKTGTAETDEKDKTHAWFSAFVPADNPSIVITVLVEKGGEGSTVAAPIAKQILSSFSK